MTPLVPADRPTLYFIGVTTASSSIMRVFPAWTERLGLDAGIRSIDFPLHADPERYRDAVRFIRNDSMSRGALVTTHKIDLFRACRDLFDDIDSHAALMGETSCLSKHDGRLICHAKDPISAGLALDALLPNRHFATTGADAFVIGAGGSAIALAWHLMQPARSGDVPARMIVSDRDAGRLAEFRRIHAQIGTAVPLVTHQITDAAGNDAILATVSPGSLVVNATGLGKDRPGSPLTDAARLPQRGIVWELNYRGALVFLDQARAQATARALQVEDGWTYFIHGWTQVIGEVFRIAIPTAGPGFAELARIAGAA